MITQFKISAHISHVEKFWRFEINQCANMHMYMIMIIRFVNCEYSSHFSCPFCTTWNSLKQASCSALLAIHSHNWFCETQCTHFNCSCLTTITPKPRNIVWMRFCLHFVIAFSLHLHVHVDMSCQLSNAWLCPWTCTCTRLVSYCATCTYKFIFLFHQMFSTV